MSVIVVEVGVPSWGMDAEKTLAARGVACSGVDALRRQLRLAHDLREELVEIYRAYDSRKSEIWSQHPEVADAEAAVKDAEEWVDRAKRAVDRERSKQRKRRIAGPDADELTAAQAELRHRRGRRKAAKDAAHAELGPEFIEAGRVRHSAETAARKRYVDDGLFWATGNDVLKHHRTAIGRVRKDRERVADLIRRNKVPASTPLPELRHHRFDGSGTVTVQLQRQSGMPPRTPQVLADTAGRYRNVLSLPWIHPWEFESWSREQQRQAGRGFLRMRMGSAVDGSAEWTVLPVQMHRMLPPDADVCEARLSVRKCAGHLKVSLMVTAKIPDPESVTDGPDVALHLGWLREDHGVRAGNWRTTEPLDIPVELRDVMRPDRDGMTGTIVAPDALIDRIRTRPDDIQSSRDLALDAVRRKLADWLKQHGPVDHPHIPDRVIAAGDVSRWESPARFAALAHWWRDADGPLGEIGQALEAWRAPDRADWERQEHGRQRAIRCRDDLYRQVAVVISSQAGRVVVDDMSVAELAQGEDLELPAEVERGIRRRRHGVAPGRLRELVAAAARRDGVPVEVVSAANLTVTHRDCGFVSEFPGPARPRMCEGCGGRYDPDLSATALMLDRLREVRLRT